MHMHIYDRGDGARGAGEGTDGDRPEDQQPILKLHKCLLLTTRLYRMELACDQ
jgi:hypothetical protein